MKTSIPYSLLLAAASCGLALGADTAYTTPVGYTTSEVLKQNQYNLIGITLHNPTVSAGIIVGESATSVTVSGVDFTAILTAGNTYVLELSNGVIQEITSWTATTLNTPQDITSFVNPNTTTFKLRQASTIAQLFGAANESGLQGTPDGDSNKADQIFIPNGAGFTVVFYDVTDGWVDTSFNGASNLPVVYTDGILIQRRGVDKTLVFTGEVKTTPTAIVTENQYTYLSSVYPVGVTLGNSGLSNFVKHTPDGDSSTADLVYITNGTGGYDVAFYDDTDGWVNTSFDGVADKAITSGFIIQRRAASAYMATITPPAYYSSL